MNLAKLGLILIFIGFLIIFIALLLPIIMTFRLEGITEVAGIGCIVIFFIFICSGYGASHLVLPLFIATIVLTIVVLIAGLIVFRESRKIIKNSEII